MPSIPASRLPDSAIVRLALAVAAMLFALFGSAELAKATPYNSPTVDGIVNVGTGDDWDSDEILYENLFPDPSAAWGPFNDLEGFWATWDTSGIYFAVTGALWDTSGGQTGANSVNLYLDIDYGIDEPTGISDLSVIDSDQTLGPIGANLKRTLTVGADFGCDFGYTCWAGKFDLGLVDLRENPSSPVNLFDKESTGADPANPVNEVDGAKEGRDRANHTGYELFIAWDVLFPGSATTIPPGTRIAVVVAQVGGDDSLSPESMPKGIDDAARTLEEVITFELDENGDGIPDEASSISGTVILLSDPPDLTSRVELVALLDGETEISRASTQPGGGLYKIGRLRAGTYTVALESNAYLAPDTVVTVTDNQAVTGVDFRAEQVTGGVQLSLRFVDGPEAASRSLDVVAELLDPITGKVVRSETIEPSESLDVLLGPAQDGDYEVRITTLWPTSANASVPSRTGYGSIQQDVVVANGEVTDLGTLDLSIVRPTRIVFYEPSETRDGEPITAAFTTVSLPDSSFYSYVEIEAGFANDDGDEAIYGVGNVTLSTSRMDPAFPPEGLVEFWSSPDGVSKVDQPLEDPAAWEPGPGEVPSGRASFWFTGDRNEVVRLRAATPSATVRDGILEVGVLPIEPAVIVMTAASNTMLAGQPGGIDLMGQLKDIADNDVRLADFQITFDITPTVPGLRPTLVLTESDGSFGQTGDVDFFTTVSGAYTVIARGTTASGTEIQSDPLSIVVTPDEPNRLELTSAVALEDDQPRLDYHVTLTDLFGNASPTPGAVLAVTAGPTELVASAPSTLPLDDTTGEAEFVVELVDGAVGVVEVTVELSQPDNLEVAPATLRTELLFKLVAADEPAPESEEPNSLPDLDLTALYARIERDTLVVQVPFQTTTLGSHMMLLLEPTNTPEGATTDPFKFGAATAIGYAHTVLPDFVLTYKVQAGDYGDFRRPARAPGEPPWDSYDGQAWQANKDGVDILPEGWATKSENLVTFRVPIRILEEDLEEPFLAGRDTVRMQVYVAQQTGDDPTKSLALDSVPHDETEDRVPPPGGGGYRLQNWAEVVPVLIPGALSIDSLAFDPPEVMLGESTVLIARPMLDLAEAIPDTIYQVFADFSPFGGNVLAALNDDGEMGDAVAGDGFYSRQVNVPPTLLAQDITVFVQAAELTTGERTTASTVLTVTGETEFTLILQDIDPEEVGDDHGPNQPNAPNLYYTYPTNGVFFPGVFDLQGLEIFDGPKMVFRVRLGDLTDPSEPGAADWGAPNPGDDTACAQGQKVDFNLQNIVILIDSEPGQGSIKLPENRWADVAPQDAWEYALIADGWWKGLVQSNGESTSGSWTINKLDEHLYFCTNADSNFVDIVADKGLLGLDEESTTEEVMAAVQSWDLIVVMCGHDGDSNDGNWGGVRWVNDGRAEWQFGGGKNGEAGRERDANIMDILVHTGIDPFTGKRRPVGRSQEEQLDFTTDEARRRFEDPKILVSVELEAEELLDTAPPVVTFLNGPGRALTPWFVLKDAPVSAIASVEDQTGVDSAWLLWRGVGEPRENNREIPLGLLYSDLPNDGVTWIADIRYEDVSESGVTNEVERTLPGGTTERVRYITLSFDAVDVLGNATDPDARQEYVMEIPVEPVAVTATSVTAEDVEDLGGGGIQFYLPEGSRIILPGSFFDGVFGRDPGATIVVQYEALGESDLNLTPSGDQNESVLTSANRFVNTARRFSLFTVGSDSALTEIEILEEPAIISVHYPRYDTGGVRPESLQLFRWSEVSERWVLTGGHAEDRGSTVTAYVREMGLYGVFTKSGDAESDILVSGLQLSPNPFSPNGDGLHDFLNITYVLPEPINQANVEIFDMRGRRVRTLKFLGTEVTVNRTLGIIWDGKDEQGGYVPMGIYICRVEVLGAIVNRWERATAAVAVVR